jgi:hypothetical protein
MGRVRDACEVPAVTARRGYRRYHVHPGMPHTVYALADPDDGFQASCAKPETKAQASASLREAWKRRKEKWGRRGQP